MAWLVRLTVNRVSAFVVAVFAVGASAATVMAQAEQGFQPATGLGKEALPAGPLLYTAYALVWVVLIGYVFLLWRRLGRVEQELREVNARISKQGGRQS